MSERIRLVDPATGLDYRAGGSVSDPGVVQGNVASGATDSGNPVKMGGYASSGAPTAVSAGQRANVWLGLNGQTIVGTYGATGADGIANTVGYFLTATSASAPLTVGNTVFNGATWDRQRGDINGLVTQSALSSTFWNYAAAASGIVNTTTAVTIKAAAGASVRNYLKTLTISHDALGAATEIAIRDGAAGTVLWRGRLQTAATDSASGSVIQFDPPLKGTANTLMEVVTLTAVTGGVYVNATGFTGS